MSKFYINKDGVPAPCRAKSGDCPYGGEGGSQNYFDTLEQAELYAAKLHDLHENSSI